MNEEGTPGGANLRIREILTGIHGAGTFAARRTAEAEDLALEVEGIGPLTVPIPEEQARRLCQLARPAAYGRGEETLVDEGVRHTWEVPKDLVTLDESRWNRTLEPVLNGLREDLGLPGPARLEAQFHSMLVYAPGQFFLPHQDTEKEDGMVGTLVVTLPSSFKGGEFVVEHRGMKVRYRRTKAPLSFVAFYADCRHEVRPVEEGYRVVLTYNLVLRADEAAWATLVDPAALVALGDELRTYFEEPRSVPSWWPEGNEPPEPPDRFVFLLDHEYTEHGLAWNRLKGDDAVRAAALRAAASEAGLEAALALGVIHELWECYANDWDAPWTVRGRWRGWDEPEDDEALSVGGAFETAPEDYELGDLHETRITLDRWVAPGRKKVEVVHTSVGSMEFCSATPSVELEPYESQYEGFMGNWGNTMDFWYRRAAVVLWPRAHAWKVRAEASPSWALEVLWKRVRKGALDEAREGARALLPFWEAVGGRDGRRSTFGRALRVAEGLAQPELAAALLEPFHLERLSPSQAPAFAALVQRYGEDWARSRLESWATRRTRAGGFDLRTRDRWFSLLPRVSEALRAAGGDAGSQAAHLVLDDQWRGLSRELEEVVRIRLPSRRRQAIERLARPTLAVLEGAVHAGNEDLRVQILRASGVGEEGERDAEPSSGLQRSLEGRVALPFLMSVLREADRSLTPGVQGAIGLDAIRAQTIEILQERLASPPRRDDDRSIQASLDCDCALCDTLGEFLGASDQKELEWPIAEDKRKHVHRAIDDLELPVRHATRRRGRPYTLILTKTADLFAREEQERRSWEQALQRLRGRERE